MQRRKYIVLFQAREHFPIDDDRAVVFRAAVNNAMADSNQFDRLAFPQPVSGDRDGRRNIDDFVRWIRLVDELRSVETLRAQPWPGANPVDLSFDET